MSKQSIERVTCPACDHPQEVVIYISINAERLPGATEALIDGSWERMTCEACATPFRIDHRLLYTDLPNERWIVQHARVDRARFAALEGEAVAVFRREWLEIPPEAVQRQARGIAPRICFSRPQLAEKLLAWRHVLDDRALECFKLVLLRDGLERLFPLGPVELQLVAVAPERLTFVALSLENDAPLDRLTVPTAGLERIRDDLESFRPAYPELFERAYVNATRYLLGPADEASHAA